MIKSSRILVIVLAAAALLVAGCGEDSTLSKAEFTKEVDAICWKTHNENFKGFQAFVVKNIKDFSKPASQQAALGEGVETITVPALRKGIKELEDLDAAEDEKKNLEEFISALEQSIKTAEENPADKKVTDGLIYADPHKLAREYDLGRCASLP